MQNASETPRILQVGEYYELLMDPQHAIEIEGHGGRPTKAYQLRAAKDIPVDFTINLAGVKAGTLGGHVSNRGVIASMNGGWIQEGCIVVGGKVGKAYVCDNSHVLDSHVGDGAYVRHCSVSDSTISGKAELSKIEHSTIAGQVFVGSVVQRSRIEEKVQVRNSVVQNSLVAGKTSITNSNVLNFCKQGSLKCKGSEDLNINGKYVANMAPYGSAYVIGDRTSGHSNAPAKIVLDGIPVSEMPGFVIFKSEKPFLPAQKQKMANACRRALTESPSPIGGIVASYAEGEAESIAGNWGKMNQNKGYLVSVLERTSNLDLLWGDRNMLDWRTAAYMKDCDKAQDKAERAAEALYAVAEREFGGDIGAACLCRKDLDNKWSKAIAVQEQASTDLIDRLGLGSFMMKDGNCSTILSDQMAMAIERIQMQEQESFCIGAAMYGFSADAAGLHVGLIEKGGKNEAFVPVATLPSPGNGTYLAKDIRKIGLISEIDCMRAFVEGELVRREVKKLQGKIIEFPCGDKYLANPIDDGNLIAVGYTTQNRNGEERFVGISAITPMPGRSVEANLDALKTKAIEENPGLGIPKQEQQELDEELSASRHK